jgi:PII-like signaling protein
VLHTAKILRPSEDMPMVVEITHSLKKIEQFLPVLNEMIINGLVTHWLRSKECESFTTKPDLCGCIK